MSDDDKPDHGVHRRRILKGAALGAAVPLLSARATAAQDTARDTSAHAGAAEPSPAAVRHGAAQGRPGTDRTTRTGGRGGATFRWFGTSGWRIDFAGRTVLSDPYLTRFPTGLFTGAFDSGTRLRTDETRVRRHMGEPELVLVSHSHWDHVNDVPYIAEQAPNARIVGTETTYHLLRSLGVNPARLVVVRGGEVLDFDGCVVEVVSSRHSRNKVYGYFAPGTLHAPPARAPETIGELPEGDTLAFQVTPPGGPSAFLMGASDFSERDTAGLRPDVAMVAVPGTTAVHRYVPRLLAALGHPRTVVPVHWDNFEAPLANPVPPDPTIDLERFVAQVREAGPGSRVVVPEYLTSYDLG